MAAGDFNVPPLPPGEEPAADDPWPLDDSDDAVAALIAGSETWLRLEEIGRRHERSD